MWLAVPAKITKIEGTTAFVDMTGNKPNADIALLENINIGDYVLIHAGFAIQKYDATEAVENIELIKEVLKKSNDERT